MIGRKKYKVAYFLLFMDKVTGLFMDKIKKISDFNNVNFIILYGSRAVGKENLMSDYDLAVYYDGDKKKRFKFLLNASFDKKFDVKIFQDLPIYIRKDVLKGKIIYLKKGKESFVYDVAYKTIKEFESFKKYYYDYIKMRPILK